MKLRRWKFALLLLTTFILVFFSHGCLDRFDEGPPITTIINPASGTVLDGIVPIVVTAYDDKGVKNVRLLIDGTEVGSVDGNVLRYEWDTRPIADNRQHFITAYAVDEDDNVGPSAITSVTLTDLAQDTLPQIVTISHPLNGQIVSGGLVNVAVNINRFINNPIDSVQFYIDGARVFTDTEFPYLYQWDITGLVDGTEHSLFAISYDRFGYNISSGVTSVIVNTDNYQLDAPQPAIINPLNNQTVRGLVNIVCRVQNLVGTNEVDSVVFVVDGFRIGSDTDNTDNIFTRSWDTSTLPDASRHTIFAVVYDRDQFNVSTGFVSVTVDSDNGSDVVSPTASIIFPTDGTNFSVSQTSSVRVVADAFDDTRVDSVQIYIDGIKMITDTVPLYEYQWNFAGYTVGINHVIYVKAFDPSGNVGVAQTVVTLSP